MANHMPKVPLSDLLFTSLVRLLLALDRELGVAKARAKPDCIKAVRDAWVAWGRQCVAFWSKLERRCSFARKGPCSIHALLRLACPALDTERSYAIKESVFLFTFVKALAINGTAAAHMMCDAAHHSNARPLPLRVRDFFAARPAAGARSRSNLTIGLVNAHLDTLAAPCCTPHERRVAFLALFAHAHPSPDEALVLTRCVLKSPWNGQRPFKVLLETFQAGLYSRTIPFRQLCFNAIGGAAADASDRLGLFLQTAQPARACTPLHVWATLAQGGTFRGDVLIETKIDGWRLQVHMFADGGARAFTHSGRAFSRPLGDHAVYFSRVVAKLREALAPQPATNGSARSCIFDCEVVVVRGGQVERFGSVGLLPRGDAVNEREVEGGRHHCVVLFDLLMADGELLVDRPLRERRHMLERLVAHIPQWVELSRATHARWSSAGRDALGRRLEPPEPAAHAPLDGAHNEVPPRECPIRLALARAIVRGDEGLVVKDLDATYYDRQWVKLKPCYVGGVCDELQLLVLGACHGEGRHTRSFSKLALGARVVDANGDVFFHRACDTGIGLNDDEVARVSAHFSNADVETVDAADALPDWCAGDGWSRRRPARLVRDWRDGILADVMASEFLPFTRASRGPSGAPLWGDASWEGESARATGYYMRFPRIVRLRWAPGGAPSDAHTLAQLREIFLASRPEEQFDAAGRAPRAEDGADADDVRATDATSATNGASARPRDIDGALDLLRRSDAAFAERARIAPCAQYGHSPVSTPDSAAAVDAGTPSSSARVQPTPASTPAPISLAPTSSLQPSTSPRRPPSSRPSTSPRRPPSSQPSTLPRGAFARRATLAHSGARARVRGEALTFALAAADEASVGASVEASVEALRRRRGAPAACAHGEPATRDDGTPAECADGLRVGAFASCTVLLDPVTLSSKLRNRLGAQLRALGASVLDLTTGANVERTILRGPDEARARVTHVLIDSRPKADDARGATTATDRKRTWLIRFVMWRERFASHPPWVFVDFRLFDGDDVPDCTRENWAARYAEAFVWSNGDGRGPAAAPAPDQAAAHRPGVLPPFLPAAHLAHGAAL